MSKGRPIPPYPAERIAAALAAEAELKRAKDEPTMIAVMHDLILELNAAKQDAEAWRQAAKRLEQHREQARTRWQRYRVAAADKLAAYRERTKEERRIYGQVHRAEKREHYRAKNQIWRHENPDRARAITQRRRARRRGNGGSYTALEWQALCQKYDYRCLCCGKREPNIKLTVDHVVPLDKGGTNDIANIQPLCGECNSRKGANIIDYRPEHQQRPQYIQQSLF